MKLTQKVENNNQAPRSERVRGLDKVQGRSVPLFLLRIT